MRKKLAAYLCLYASGFFFSASVFLAFAAQREYRLFKSLVDAESGLPYEHSPDKPAATESLPAFRNYGYPVRMMNVVHELLERRGRVFSGRDYSLRESFYTSGSDHLATGQGACASFSWVLAEALQIAGYNANMAQLRCEDGSLCHTIVEVNDEGRSVVLDPVQNLFYLNQDERPATLEEINQGMATPFEGSISTTILDIRSLQADPKQVVYTNWSRIPLIGDVFGKLIVALAPEMERFSLRSRILNVHQALSISSIVLAAIFFAFFKLLINFTEVKSSV